MDFLPDNGEASRRQSGSMTKRSRRTHSPEKISTRPFRHCPTNVELGYLASILNAHCRHGCPAASVAPNSQAPKPLSGAPKARGLTASGEPSDYRDAAMRASVGHCPTSRVQVFTSYRPLRSVGGLSSGSSPSASASVSTDGTSSLEVWSSPTSPSLGIGRYGALLGAECGSSTT